ncbi:MAG: OpgC domain-containing protein [Pseudomonadota bacterium]
MTTKQRSSFRDPRLDFFRGVAMFIILLAHTPGNTWTLWIPARWGFSDATEIFVFCSGMASALAFGAVFANRGWTMGTIRVAHRVWQVYWSHIAMFFAVLFLVIALNHTGLTPEKDQVGRLNLYPFLNNAGDNLLGLMTLTYVPNYFDILPMYLVILCLIPVMMGLSRLSVWAVFALMFALWLPTQIGRWHANGVEGLEALIPYVSILDLPAQYWFNPPNNTREWFFNPFAWQLVFFTGFALMRGWIPAPPVRWWLILPALALVLANVVVSNVGVRIWTFDAVRGLGWDWTSQWRAAVIDWRVENRHLFSKTDIGVLRYLHFLALAYLAWAAAGPGGKYLSMGAVWTAVVTVVRKVGQQSLAVFVTSMVLARFLGFLMDIYAVREGMPKDPIIVALINLFGFAVIIATAYTVAWFKAEPWRKPPPPQRDEPQILGGAPLWERAA